MRGRAHKLPDALGGAELSPVLDTRLRFLRRVVEASIIVVGLALAGVDMSAWDALAQAAGLPLVKLLGGEVKPVRAYNSCGLWIQPVSQLADEAEALMADGGFTAIKLRVGRDDATEDVAAVRAVKKRVGDKITVMCDYNQRLTVNEAIRRGRMLDGEGLYWIEEPVRHDDYAGCARIAAELATPIQTGENLVDTFELLHALEATLLGRGEALALHGGDVDDDGPVGGQRPPQAVRRTAGDVVVYLPKERVLCSGDLLAVAAPADLLDRLRLTPERLADMVDRLTSAQATVVPPRSTLAYIDG